MDPTNGLACPRSPTPLGPAGIKRALPHGRWCVVGAPLLWGHNTEVTATPMATMVMKGLLGPAQLHWQAASTTAPQGMATRTSGAVDIARAIDIADSQTASESAAVGMSAVAHNAGTRAPSRPQSRRAQQATLGDVAPPGTMPRCFATAPAPCACCSLEDLLRSIQTGEHRHG